MQESMGTKQYKKPGRETKDRKKREEKKTKARADKKTTVCARTSELSSRSKGRVGGSYLRCLWQTHSSSCISSRCPP